MTYNFLGGCLYTLYHIDIKKCSLNVQVLTINQQHRLWGIVADTQDLY